MELISGHPQVTDIFIIWISGRRYLLMTQSDILGATKKLQHDLDMLQQWSDNWLLRFHLEKCSVLRVGSKKSQSNYTMKGKKEANKCILTLNGSEFEKDLDVYVDNQLNFKEHVARSTAKAYRVVRIIRRTFDYLTEDLFAQLFKSKHGDQLPSVDVYVDSPKNPVNICDLFKGKRGVLFSVLGAFTPGCTQNHIPEYLDNYDKFQSLGYDVIACVAVNDPYVMSAWAKSLNTKDKILMLADTEAKFTRAMKMDLDCRHIMGTVRSKRYSVVIEDGVIKQFNNEPDHTGLACLLCIKNMSKPR